MAANEILIFDRNLQRRRHARALAAEAADFLLAQATNEIVDRLGAVRRRFTAIADFGTPLPLLTERLVETFPAARVTRIAPLGRPDVIGDVDLLPFERNAFDLAVSALALHDVNDLPGTLAQIRRTLKPDGLFLGCLVGGSTLRELRASLAEAETEISGGVSPRVAPFADVRDMGGLLQRAGFALPVTDVETLTVRYPHFFALLADLRAMGATNTLVGRLRRPTRRALFLRAAEIYTRDNADSDGRLPATFELIFLSGWAPHESQQKPLKPGSAQVSLADVLRKP
ncbi:MAG: methyltransferase domain-containing protein [Methylovirgula sp.]|uniref:methyltransferase domain-containing protein n=1 Tax=Methylovirgula sp. TaxID=1978224 RepID=UPI003076125E